MHISAAVRAQAAEPQPLLAHGGETAVHWSSFVVNPSRAAYV